MLFNSWTYLLFLLVGVVLFWLLPIRRRSVFLCSFSVIFYGMWRWDFVLLMLFSAAVDFVAAKNIASSENPRSRKAWLLTSLSLNLGLLIFFKYTYFIVDNIGFASSFAGARAFTSRDLGLSIILPLGISFYTFQTISYSIDVYRKVQEPVRDFLDFLAYVIFWPQLVAGPILRAGEVLPQLHHTKRLRLSDLSVGSTLIVFGLFKKVVLADNIAPYADMLFSMDASVLTALDVWVATFLFGFQIYFDFSGYSDIAIGSAALLGIRFPNNFNWPYLATGPKEFWQRWHISLSAWIRDYLYLPLTGRKFETHSVGGLATALNSKAQRNKALFATWVIMGLWHGANWTFMAWGIYHACIIFVYRQLPAIERFAKRWPIGGWIIWLPLSMLGWIFFRAISLSHAFQMIGKVISPFEYRLSPAIVGLSNPRVGWAYLWAFFLTLTMVALWTGLHSGFLASIRDKSAVGFRFAGVMLATVFVLIFLQQKTQFIYFQF